MTNLKEVVSKYGHSVSVRYIITVTKENLHVFEISALCGKTVESSRVTVGSVDGPRLVSPTKESLQKTLDTHRQRVADEASWKERVRENIAGLE